jgi:hypothetical protein
MLTERQWRIRIARRREGAARLAELEQLICAAIETHNTRLEQVLDWLYETDKLHEELQVFGYSPFGKKKPFDRDDLIARLGTPDQQHASAQRRAEAQAEKDARDRKAAHLYDIERLSHAKLAEPPKCVYPERLHCDYYDDHPRCKHMEYGGRLGFWLCNAAQNSV